MPGIKEKDIVQNTIRLPKKLDDKLTNATKEKGISKNAYIILAIEEKLKRK